MWPFDLSLDYSRVAMHGQMQTQLEPFWGWYLLIKNSKCSLERISFSILQSFLILFRKSAICWSNVSHNKSKWNGWKTNHIENVWGTGISKCHIVLKFAVRELVDLLVFVTKILASNLPRFSTNIFIVLKNV